MSRKPSFAHLRDKGGQTPATSSTALRVESVGDVAAGPASRQGRKQIAGFFSPEMSFALHMLARRRGNSLQALMTEAFNDVLRKHGESPIGD